MIVVNCPGCGGRVCAPDSMAGRSAKCRKCGVPVELPGEMVAHRGEETRMLPGQVTLRRRLRRYYARRYVYINFLLLLALTAGLAAVELRLAARVWPLGPEGATRAATDDVRKIMFPGEEIIDGAVEYAGVDYLAVRWEAHRWGWDWVGRRLAFFPWLALFGGVLVVHIVATVFIARKPKPPAPPPAPAPPAALPRTVVVSAPTEVQGAAPSAETGVQGAPSSAETAVQGAAAAPTPAPAPAPGGEPAGEPAGEPRGFLGTGQKVVLWAGILLLVAAGLFPPWRSGAPGGRRGLGYAFLLDPPAADAEIDLLRLLVPCALLAVVTAGLMVTLKGRKRSG